MATPWPADLPQFALGGKYQEQPDINIAQFAPGVGEPFTRYRTLIDSSTIVLSFDMTNDQIASFMSFFNDDLIDGIRPFTFTDSRTGATATFTFLDAPQSAAITPFLYHVNMNLRRMP